MSVTLLTGGARSGKSTVAVRMASTFDGPVAFVATAEARDEEMAERIVQHRAARPAGWLTIEEPVALADAIADAPGGACLIVDCLTLWVSNLLERGVGHAEIAARAADAAKAAAARQPPVLIVTNEVGSGIVPMHPETRAYRDTMGTVNAIVGDAAQRVLFVVAGRAIPLPAEEVGLDGFDR